MKKAIIPILITGSLLMSSCGQTPMALHLPAPGQAVTSGDEEYGQTEFIKANAVSLWYKYKYQKGQPAQEES